MNVHFILFICMVTMKQEEKSKIKRDAIIKATLALVNSNGFHATPMSKLAKLAGVSPGTIYLYFENKQDLVNKVYLEVKEKFTKYSFVNYQPELEVEENFKDMWYRIAAYKLKEIDEALFLAQCDNTPIVDENIRQEGIVHLTPLIEVMHKGKNEGIIKDISDYLLYAYTITPISFLIVMQNREAYNLDPKSIDEAYESAWDSIRK